MTDAYYRIYAAVTGLRKEFEIVTTRLREIGIRPLCPLNSGLLQFLYAQASPVDLSSSKRLVLADSVYLQCNEALGGQTVLEISTRHTVEPSLNARPICPNANVIPTSE